MLSGAGAVAMAQGREDGDDGIDIGKDIGEGDADLLRRPFRFAGDVHDAIHTLDDKP